jgi:hypothetical protein
MMRDIAPTAASDKNLRAQRLGSIHSHYMEIWTGSRSPSGCKQTGGASSHDEDVRVRRDRTAHATRATLTGLAVHGLFGS